MFSSIASKGLFMFFYLYELLWYRFLWFSENYALTYSANTLSSHSLRCNEWQKNGAMYGLLATDFNAFLSRLF
jgi:hypothetical protein